MRRRGQATVLAVALTVPLLVLALIGLVLLGARVQAEQAQRRADEAALAAVLGRTVTPPPGGALTLTRDGTTVHAHVELARARLRLPFLPPLSWTASASTAARRVTLADGGTGAVLVQPVGTTMVG